LFFFLSYKVKVIDFSYICDRDNKKILAFIPSEHLRRFCGFVYKTCLNYLPGVGANGDSTYLLEEVLDSFILSIIFNHKQLLLV